MMDLVIGDLAIEDQEVFVYIDDVLIATETLPRHFEVLEMVLSAMRKANLKLKPQKCSLVR